MKLFTPRQRVIVTDPAAIPAVQGCSGVVETLLTTGLLEDSSRGNAAIIRMDDPASFSGLHFRYIIFYAAECSPLDPQQSSLF
jgi:hypothetical protein